MVSPHSLTGRGNSVESEDYVSHRLLDPGLELADLTVKLQAINRLSLRDRFHSAMFLPAGSLLESAAAQISEEISGAVEVNGEAADFETVIGTIENGQVNHGILFECEPSLVVIKRPEALPVDVLKAVESVLSTGEYTLSRNGTHTTLQSPASILCLSSPVNGCFENEVPLLEQVECPPQLLSAAGLVVADSPCIELESEYLSSDQLVPDEGPYTSSVDEPQFSNHAECEIKVTVKADENSGRFCGEPPYRPHSAITDKQQAYQTMRKLAAGFARFREENHVDDSPHATSARFLNWELQDRINRIQLKSKSTDELSLLR